MVRISPRLVLPLIMLVANKFIDYTNPATVGIVRMALFASMTLVRRACTCAVVRAWRCSASAQRHAYPPRARTQRALTFSFGRSL